MLMLHVLGKCHCGMNHLMYHESSTACLYSRAHAPLCADMCTLSMHLFVDFRVQVADEQVGAHVLAALIL